MPVMTQTSRLHRTPPMPPGELAALRARLVEERDRMTQEYRRDLAAAQAIQEEGTEDFEELAEIEVEREQLFAYSEQDRDRLRLIEEALQRMDAGTYGFCLSSGLPIPLERLRALPWARYRADMQERLERREGLSFHYAALGEP
jgi:RNA polymerase-binding transcription factor